MSDQNQIPPPPVTTLPPELAFKMEAQRIIQQVPAHEQIKQPCECGYNEFYFILRQKIIPATHPKNILRLPIKVRYELLKCTECGAMYWADTFKKADKDTGLILDGIPPGDSIS